MPLVAEMMGDALTVLETATARAPDDDGAALVVLVAERIAARLDPRRREARLELTTYDVSVLVEQDALIDLRELDLAKALMLVPHAVVRNTIPLGRSSSRRS